MKVLYDGPGTKAALLLEKKDNDALTAIIAAVLLNKPLNKQSNAYKLAKQLDDELLA